MSDLIGVRVDGVTFTGWTSFSCRRSLEAVAGKFQLLCADRPGFPLRVGSSVVVTVDGDEVVTGFVDVLRKTIAQRQVRLEGRDRTADLVDCSAYSPPYEFQDELLSAIAAKLADPFGVTVVQTADDGEPFERFAVHPGETAYECIARATRARGLLATTDGLGRLVLARPTGTDAGVALVEGRNVLDASLVLDDSERHAEYRVVAQDLANADPNELEAPEGRATDAGARKGRVLLLIAAGAATAADCQQLAEWEAARRSSAAGRVTCMVQGSRTQEGGMLWRPGLLVPVQLPTLRVDARMLITDVALEQGKAPGEGTKTEITLARADSYRLELEKPTKRDPEAEWGADVDEEGARGEG